MATKRACPLSVNELEWECFLETYCDRFQRILKFYTLNKAFDYMVNCLDGSTYSFECLANKNRVFVVLPETPPDHPSAFLMYNMSLIESTMSRR